MECEASVETERQKMLAGELYNALDPELVRDRDRARDLCQILNATREADRELRRGLLLKIFGKGGDTAWLQPRFFCDYVRTAHEVAGIVQWAGCGGQPAVGSGIGAWPGATPRLASRSRVPRNVSSARLQ